MICLSITVMMYFLEISNLFSACAQRPACYSCALWGILVNLELSLLFLIVRVRTPQTTGGAWIRTQMVLLVKSFFLLFPSFYPSAASPTLTCYFSSKTLGICFWFLNTQDWINCLWHCFLKPTNSISMLCLNRFLKCFLLSICKFLKDNTLILLISEF